MGNRSGSVVATRRTRVAAPGRHTVVSFSWLTFPCSEAVRDPRRHRSAEGADRELAAIDDDDDDDDDDNDDSGGESDGDGSGGSGSDGGASNDDLHSDSSFEVEVETSGADSDEESLD